MQPNSKYGLRNATDFLNRIRRKYSKQAEESNLMHNKTFIEEESLELYENAHRQEEGKQAQTHPEHQQHLSDSLSQIEPIQKQQNTFCDRLIVKSLQETLRVYREDLKILSENKQFLQENIDLMSDKIRKLRELQISSKALARDNEKAKQYLHDLMKEHHDSELLLFRSQIHQQEIFNSFRTKIRFVLKDLSQDYFYIGFSQHWNHHIKLLQADHALIDRQLRKQIKEERSRGENKGESKAVKAIPAPQRERNTRAQEDMFGVDEPKPKKKLSEAERASLLGDLKSFAKNFKFPNS